MDVKETYLATMLSFRLIPAATFLTSHFSIEYGHLFGNRTVNSGQSQAREVYVFLVEQQHTRVIHVGYVSLSLTNEERWLHSERIDSRGLCVHPEAQPSQK